MRTREKNSKLKNIKGIIVLCLMFIFCLAAAGPAEVNAVSTSSPPGKTSRILYINSYHRGYAWSDGIEQGLRKRLDASGKKIDFYVEFLDTLRFSDFSHLAMLAETFVMKHSKIRYDVIAVSDNNAFTFAVKYRNRLFPDTPLIFCGYNSFRPEVLKGITHVTGVNEEVDFTGSIDMALTVQPKTETLVFITSDYYVSGKLNQERVETSIIPAYRDRYKIIQFKNLYLQDMEQRLSQLPPRTLVFVFGDPFDNSKELFIALPEYYRRIAAASTVPVYSFWDFTINTGVMGGRIITGPDQGRMVAEIALKVLDGSPADSIPVVMETPTSKIFDFNAMQRFDISAESLPPDSIVINQPQTFYYKYKNYIRASLSVFIVLSVLVILLAILLRKSRILSVRLYAASEERQKAVAELQQYKEHLEDTVAERTAVLDQTNRRLENEIIERKKAEDAIRAIAQRYRTILSHQHYGILVVTEDNMIEYANQAFCDQLSLSEAPSELIGLTAAEFIRTILPAYADPVSISAFIGRVVAEGRLVLGEEVLMHSGQVYQVDFTPILIDGKSNGRMWMHRDITSRKIEEDQIKASLKEKEILLKEIHHRVKNNLAIIASILSLQSRYVKDQTSLEIFRECENRVRTMAMIHTKLYQSKDLAHIDFTSYVRELANDLFMSYRVNPDTVSIKIDIGDISPDINTAIPIGLILNELLSNALKHAFRGSEERRADSVECREKTDEGEMVKKKEIIVSMKEEPPATSKLSALRLSSGALAEGSPLIVLSVSDNGIGFSEDIDFRNTKSLGLQLVTALVEQLDGTIEIKRDGGAAFIVTFKNEER